ncbi:hypothetical protein Tco_1335937 [Tanacetum coccineum]
MCVCSATVTGKAMTTAMTLTRSIHQGLLDEANDNILGMKIIRNQSGNTIRVLQSRFYNGKLVQTLLERHFILSLESSLSGDCDVEKNDRRTGFVDFNYDMGRSINVMGRSIIKNEFLLQGCAISWEGKLQHMGALLVSRVAYITLTKVVKEVIWLKDSLQSYNLS